MFDASEKESVPMDKQGDGMHHHTIDEDEGGGYHSKHTHPDGHEDHDDHATFEDAKADMDSKFGHGADSEQDGDSGGDMDDAAGSYERSCE